jgi:hypothetical protein
MVYADYRFKTLEECYKKISEYMKEYNPQGYNTKAKIHYSGEWVLSFERWESCD